MLVSGIDKVDIESSVSQEEYNALKRLTEIKRMSNIPFGFIRFAVDEEIESVYLYSKEGKFKEITMKELTAIYEKQGLPVNIKNKEATRKYLNDKTSSAYHKWQRDSLGYQLKVSDIDLIKLNQDSISEIYELKRSFIALEKWEPYTDDYNNFRLLSNVFINTNIDVKIAYNLRTKNPWKDDVTKLKIFNVNKNSGELVSFDQIISLENFIK